MRSTVCSSGTGRVRMNHFQELFLSESGAQGGRIYNTLKQGLSFHDAIALFKGTTSDITISGGLVGHLPAHEMEPQTRSSFLHWKPVKSGVRNGSTMSVKIVMGMKFITYKTSSLLNLCLTRRRKKVIRNQYQTGMFSQQQQQLMGEYLSKHAPEFQWDVLDKAVHYLVYLSTGRINRYILPVLKNRKAELNLCQRHQKSISIFTGINISPVF